MIWPSTASIETTGFQLENLSASMQVTFDIINGWNRGRTSETVGG